MSQIELNTDIVFALLFSIPWMLFGAILVGSELTLFLTKFSLRWWIWETTMLDRFPRNSPELIYFIYIYGRNPL
ncbi:unnamed protein product [Auanema sp. JU1783]|nr:unnamed protein product [Auanema sp. JU1783]